MASEADVQTPGIGSRHSYRRHAKEFLELHDQVQTSVNLLDSLESFLSTFQKDLSAVSGQISELQNRSKEIDNRLNSRRRIERPLSNLITDITLSPALTTLILDSDVGEPWITAIPDFEKKLETTKARSRVKAARDLGEVAEGLRIVAATKLRAFFLAMFRPIRGSVTTNMQVIQTSVLLKYSPLFAFLQRQASNVAHELQRSYVAAARMYYETGFRRYLRSLGWVKARFIEKHVSIVTSDREVDLNIDMERLAHAKIEGLGVTLAYMADDKAHKEPVEALFRSLLLVFMDNATVEYTFVKAFFSYDSAVPTDEPSTSATSPSELLSPDQGAFTEQQSMVGSDYGAQPIRSASTAGANGFSVDATQKEAQATVDALWKQIMDPVLGYSETFVRSVLEPMPPSIPLLTMIRLAEDVILEVQKRNCPPVEFFVFSLRLKMWPVFQKSMSDHIDALKKLAEGTSSSYFSRAQTTSDASVTGICKRYTTFFNSLVNLTDQEEETMIFSNLLRLRQELSKLILRHTNSNNDTVAKATTQSQIYEIILQGLSRGAHFSVHPKSQQEIAYWANLEEESRRKIISAGHSSSRQPL